MKWCRLGRTIQNLDHLNTRLVQNLHCNCINTQILCLCSWNRFHKLFYSLRQTFNATKKLLKSWAYVANQFMKSTPGWAKVCQMPT